MAHSTRTRPLSASTYRSQNTAKSGTVSSEVMGRSGVMGLEDGSKSDRPLPELLNLLLDAAHQRHESRGAVRHSTQAHRLSSKRVATLTSTESGGAAASCRGTGTGSGTGTSNGTPPGVFGGPAAFSPVFVDVSRYSLNPAGHSSTTVYAWGESPPAGSRNLSATAPAASTSAAAHRAHHTQLRAPVAKARTDKALAQPSDGGLSVVLSSPPSPSSLRSPLSPLCQVPGAPALQRSDPGSPQGIRSAARTHPGHQKQPQPQQAKEQGSELDCPRLRSTSGGGGCGADWEGSWSPRSICRSDVVARALAPWQGAELEVVCLYDCNFQTANRRSQHGVPLRVPPRTDIGPVSYLYRWYCKRATQFRTTPAPGELSDAPTMPQTEEPWRAAAAAAGTAPYAGRGSSTARRSQSLTGDGGSPGGGAVVPAWLRKATTLHRHGGIPIAESGANATAGCGGSGVAAADGSSFESWEKVATSSGRQLNCNLDPVMSVAELMQMLEDLEVVPQLVPRTDVIKIFNAAVQAAASASAAATAAAEAGKAAAAVHQPAAAAGKHSKLSQSQQKSQPQRHLAVATATGSGSGSGQSTAAGGHLAHPLTAKGSVHWVGSAAGTAFSGSYGTEAALTAAGARNVPPLPIGGLPGKAGSAATTATATTTTTSSSNHHPSNVIPRTQPHPEEVRFPVFKDVLVRLAVAIACIQSSPTADSLAAAAAAAAAPSKAVPPPVATQSSTAFISRASTMSAAAATPVSPRAGDYNQGSPAMATAGGAASASASAASASSPQQSKVRTMSVDESVAAVRKFMERLQLYRGDGRALKHRLDELARVAQDHAARLKANRILCIDVSSAVEAAQNVVVSTGVMLPQPHVRHGLGIRPLPTWSVLAATPAPPHLTAILTEEDQGNDSRYQPAWREFGAVALDLGVLQPGEVRKCRLLLHCRGPYTLAVRIDTSDAPFCDVTHVGLHSVPPGLPFRVDVTVRVYDVGEVAGGLRLWYNSSQDGREREIVIPVYGLVCPSSDDSIVMRKVPYTLSERSLMAAKMVRERTAAAQRALATPLVPPRRGPSPPPLTASSSTLSGYGNSSMVLGAYRACASGLESPAGVATTEDGRGGSCSSCRSGSGSFGSSSVGSGSSRSDGDSGGGGCGGEGADDASPTDANNVLSASGEEEAPVRPAPAAAAAAAAPASSSSSAATASPPAVPAAPEAIGVIAELSNAVEGTAVAVVITTPLAQ